MANNRPVYRLFKNGIIVLLILVLLIEAVSWSLNSSIRLDFVRQNGGFLLYFGSLISRMLLPETMTVFALAILIHATQYGFQIRLGDLSRRAIIGYQLSFLPTLLIAFLVFIPFTQSVRYLLVDFPHYSFATYRSAYIIDSYSWIIYFRYLFFVLLLGYSMLNISLLTNLSTNPRVA